MAVCLVSGCLTLFPCGGGCPFGECMPPQADLQANNVTILKDDSMQEKSKIILYQPDETIKLEVRLEDETVWLTQQQITELFQRERTVITKHINNVFKEKELEEKGNVHFLHIANSDKPVKVYSLDVIISVGYRVKSQRGTRFRQWANKVLKEYMLKGYSINQRLTDMEQRVDNKLMAHEQRLNRIDQKMDFFVRTSLPPAEGIFFEGQIFDAYAFSSELVKSARQSIVLIDNYVDESVLVLLDKRTADVTATVYTNRITRQLRLDLERHNAQYPPIEVRIYTQSHDRFLLIDNTFYHIGASLKDLGKKLFALSRMAVPAETILARL